MKLLAYVSSRYPDSSTNRIINNIIDDISKIHEELSIKKITPVEYDLLPSTGCRTCFAKGDCPSNKLPGDMSVQLKKEILESDIIIMASPVFSHNVSGDMKNVIDRLSYWTHIFRLASKRMYLISTAHSNGGDYVNNYMNKVFTSMGAFIIRSDSFLKTDMENHDKKIESIVESISTEIQSSKDVLPTEGQEKLFQYYKNVIKTYNKDNFEYKFYKESGLLEVERLSDYYKRLASTKRR